MSSGVMSQADHLLDALMAEGCRNPVVRLEDRDGKLLFEGARGIARADRPDPMTTDHRFHLASVAKTMTAVLILKGLERGLLGERGLAASLEDVAPLPRSVLRDLHDIEGAGQGGAITLYQLLTHTSGLRDAMIDDADQVSGPAGPAPKSLAGRRYAGIDDAAKAWRPWDPEAPFDGARGVINLYLENGLGRAALWPPGEGYHYSDTGFMILGLIIERAFGLSYGEALEREIFAPLGLKDTYLAYFRDPPGLDAARHPESEIWLGERPSLSAGMSFSFDWAGGGVVSTAGELATFFRALRAGALFERAATLDLMRRWAVPHNLPLPRTGVGLGLFQMTHDDLTVWGHSGAWGAKMFQDVETGIVLTGTINQARRLGDWHIPFLRLARGMIRTRPPAIRSKSGP